MSATPKRASPRSEQRPRAPRGSLTAERILDAASSLAESQGFEFSTSELALTLGVGVTSIYWHFRSRDDLIAALADRVATEFYAGIDGPSFEGDQQDQVLTFFRQIWTRLRRNGLWRQAFISNFYNTIGQSDYAASRSIEAHHRVIMCIASVGIPLPDAVRAYTIMSAYTRGYVMVQHFRDEERSGAGPLRADSSVRVATASSNAEILEILDRSDPDEDFDAGLLALWHGIQSDLRRS